MTTLDGKKAYFLATSAYGRKEFLATAIAGFRGILDCLDRVEEAGILCVTGVTDIGDIEGNPKWL